MACGRAPVAVCSPPSAHCMLWVISWLRVAHRRKRRHLRAACRRPPRRRVGELAVRRPCHDCRDVLVRAHNNLPLFRRDLAASCRLVFWASCQSRHNVRARDSDDPLPQIVPGVLVVVALRWSELAPIIVLRRLGSDAVLCRRRATVVVVERGQARWCLPDVSLPPSSLTWMCKHFSESLAVSFCS